MKKILFSLLSITFVFTQACEAQQPTALMFPEKGKVVMILDANDGAKAITFDQRNGFFEKVTETEMSIQMKKPVEVTQTRQSVLPEYLKFLKSEVIDFEASEIKFVSEVIQNMYRTVSSINPAIFPDTLKLIKTKENHYGQGVWYTRENCIIIPAGELATPKTNAFTSTMYHELFHVYSRLNPAKSAQLYKLIGFESIGYQKIEVPEALKNRVLHNPDGVDFAQKISLTQEDQSVIHAVPIIYANKAGYTPEKKEFFGYLEFNLYQIEPTANGTWKVKVAEDGVSSTLKLDKQPDFFRQIKDNTGYIIHPDEVLADNFSFIMQELNGAKISTKFSAEGKQLLKDVEAILKK
ncbi:MAG: hypothetical protein JNJ57_04015 [Saprospiraceae bacterium]|nr:hypothetical protein [Saprospiraceae bacterium]